jgi:hypothetical protein
MQQSQPDDRAILNYVTTVGVGGMIAAIAAFAFIGWFGVGLVGLLGLWYVNDLRTIRRDDDGDIAYPDFRRTPYADALYEQARRNHHQELASEGLRQEDIAAERAVLRYLKNTVFLALMVLGFGMAMIHG